MAASLNDLGALLYRRGMSSEAEDLLKKALVIYERKLGPDHIELEPALMNLAALFAQHRRFREAEPLLQRSLAIRQRAYRPNHVDVAATLRLVGELHSAQRNYIRADPEFQRALAIMEKNGQTDHPMSAAIRFDLAEIYRALGYRDKALPLYMRAIELYEKLDPQSVHLAVSLEGLACLRAEEGQYSEAKSLYDARSGFWRGGCRRSTHESARASPAWLPLTSRQNNIRKLSLCYRGRFPFLNRPASRSALS